MRERSCRTCLFENTGIGVVDCDYCYGNMDTLPRWRPRPFWTPAERAGLKSMGRELRATIGIHALFMATGCGNTIRAYVQAARAAKERA
jgi:hypothetical protein